MTAVAEERRAATDEALEASETAEQPVRSTRIRELLTGAGVIVLGVVVMVLSQQLSAAHASQEFGSRWWPMVLGGAMALLGLLIALSGALRPPARDVEDARLSGVMQLAAILGLIVVYGIAWRFVHFVPITLLLVAAIMAVLGGRGWRSLLLVPAVVTAALYVVFGLLLRVPL